MKSNSEEVTGHNQLPVPGHLDYQLGQFSAEPISAVYISAVVYSAT